MSDTSATTTECKSCQLFLRVGIPAVVVFIIMVVGCIVWFDRYDKHQQQKKLQEKRDKKLQQQPQEGEEKSFEDHTVDLSMYTIPSISMVHATEPTPKNSGRDLDHMERGHTLASPTSSSNEVALTTPSFRAQRFHALIQQVHDEHVQHGSTMVPDMNDDDDDDELSVLDDDEDHHEDDDQSSIESDATPVVTNNTTIVQLPPSKDIGLIRNHLSITGTTESESTSSSASSSSTSSCASSTTSRPVGDAHGHQKIAVTSK